MVNIIQQGLSTGYYNVWTDVDLSRTTGSHQGLEGYYLVHNFTNEEKKNAKQSCHWTCDELYIIKDIYGGFLEFLKDEVI